MRVLQEQADKKAEQAETVNNKSPTTRDKLMVASALAIIIGSLVGIIYFLRESGSNGKPAPTTQITNAENAQVVPTSVANAKPVEPALNKPPEDLPATAESTRPNGPEGNPTEASIAASASTNRVNAGHPGHYRKPRDLANPTRITTVATTTVTANPELPSPVSEGVPTVEKPGKSEKPAPRIDWRGEM
jgi:hypothetical protein